MSRSSKRLALLLILLPACGGGGSDGPDLGSLMGPQAKLVSLQEALTTPPDFLRLRLDPQQAAIVSSSLRAAPATLGAGSFTMAPDPNSSGSILEGYCAGVPAEGPPTALVASKDGPVRRLAGWCETSAVAAGTATATECQLYLNLSNLNGAATGGSNLGSLWICAPACAAGSPCSPLMDSLGTISCECQTGP